MHLIYSILIDRDSYKKVLMESTMKKRDKYGEFLDSIPILGKRKIQTKTKLNLYFIKMVWINGSA